jgi:hypothetical protein
MYESQKDSEVCERFENYESPWVNIWADEELNKKKDILYNKKKITMFGRVTCEIATLLNYPQLHELFVLLYWMPFF